MNLLVDIDGCVLNFEKGISEWLGRTVPEGGSPDLDAYTHDEVHAFMYSEAFGRLDFMPGAVEMLAGLRECGHAVHICTHLPSHAMATRARQLSVLDFDSLIMVRDRTSKARYFPGCDIVIDDHPKTVAEAMAAGIAVIKPEYNYNRNAVATESVPGNHPDLWRRIVYLCHRIESRKRSEQVPA